MSESYPSGMSISCIKFFEIRKNLDIVLVAAANLSVNRALVVRYPLATRHERVAMDLRKLKKLIDLVQESGIAELEITEGEEKSPHNPGG